MNVRPKNLTRGVDGGTPELSRKHATVYEWADPKRARVRVRVLSEIEIWSEQRLVDPRHIEAARRFRNDFERAPFAPNFACLDADAILVDGGRAGEPNYSDEQMSAWGRTTSALKVVGETYSSALWHVVGSGLSTRDWLLIRRRKMTLDLAREHITEALDKLAAYYGL